MPVIKNALKKMRHDAKVTLANKGLKTNLKTVIAKARVTNTQETLTEAFSALDKAAKRNLIHKSKADRLKARLAKTVKVEVKPAAKAATKAATKKVATKKKD